VVENLVNVKVQKNLVLTQEVQKGVFVEKEKMLLASINE
jgi:hypothetical protein